MEPLGTALVLLLFHKCVLEPLTCISRSILCVLLAHNVVSMLDYGAAGPETGSPDVRHGERDFNVWYKNIRKTIFWIAVNNKSIQTN